MSEATTHKQIQEQVVIISGAGRGLGASIARSFAREGASVVINDRRSEREALALAEELGERAVALQADVTDAEAVKRLVAVASERFGAPTTIIHNALADYSFNGDARAHAESLQWSHIAQQTQTAVGGALNLIQASLPQMRQMGFGRVVMIGTNLVQNPVVPYHDYTAAKGALLALTRTMSRELGPHGVTVNMLSAGLLRVTDASRATPDVVFDLIASNTPLGRVTSPEEVADAALFFASPWSRGITGQNLIIDGGLVCD
jgi:3-oxoacyl-[acyl-carrier protein] reductase